MTISSEFSYHRGLRTLYVEDPHSSVSIARFTFFSTPLDAFLFRILSYRVEGQPTL